MTRHSGQRFLMDVATFMRFHLLLISVPDERESIA
jgi:hypothetical protein